MPPADRSAHSQAHIPFVTSKEYNVIGIDDEEYLSLMNDDGDMKEDLQPPTWPDGLGDELKEAIQKAEDEGKTVVVRVIGAMNKEQITSFKVIEE